jgi:hypothetical protein
MIFLIKVTLLIKASIAERHRSPEEDEVTWSLTSNDKFLALSVYQILGVNISGAHNEGIWKSNLSLKINIFL